MVSLRIRGPTSVCQKKTGQSHESSLPRKFRHMNDRHWNRCDVCGRFIAIQDFEDFDEQGGKAIRRLVTPDSDRSREEWKTLCKKHAGKP